MPRADLALVGFGNVGRRFVRLLDEQRQRLLDDCDLDWRVVGVATRRHGSTYDRNGVDALDAARRVEAGETLTGGGVAGAEDVIRGLAQSSVELRVLVETTTLDIAAGQPAIAHVEAALDAGCHVVTANKGPAAFAYRRLRHRAKAAGVSFLFEGAVMDGIPIFNLVRETMPLVGIGGFRGVVNSTTNHILTALEDGEEFGPALAFMQAQGIAEADASLDVDGWDAAAKGSALANVLMGADLTPHTVHREGLGPETAIRARAARAHGLRLRLVASAERGPRGIAASVRLLELPEHDLLAGLRGTANALVLTTDLLGDVAIVQCAGDLTQTAYALFSDLVTIRRRA